jgi:excinuclease ABC subunit C
MLIRMTSQRSNQFKEKLRNTPNKPGVYMMHDAFGQTLYVGKAKNLKKRISSYFQSSRKRHLAQPKIKAMIEIVHDIDYLCVDSESEALILESRLIKKYKPKYNTSLKDDKRFLLVQINPKEALPRFRLTRNKTYRYYRYYGPFPHSGSLRKTLNLMKKKFGILLHDASPKKIDAQNWRLFDDIRAEINELPNIVTEDAYRERVQKACAFLEGKTEEIIKDLHTQMMLHSEKQNFEKAGDCRDRIIAIQQTSRRTRKFERNLIGLISENESLECLKEALGLKAIPNIIECFDISHISGSFCVASMVRFTNGKPDKKNYRRYKIQSFTGNDDFKAMEEVVSRRYKRLVKEAKSLPDLIVIDGGIGQVHASIKALLKEGIEPPFLIGLAKKKETIVFSNGKDPLNLPYRNPALRLLRHLRDEAHYFANNFNADLRSKKIKESILDQFKGLGIVRKNKLINHFGSIDKIKKAKTEELTEIDGIGEKTASALLQFLNNENST